jgi:tRNA threonylcarbamoyladenosine biosynthesis protein TsaB
MDGPLSRQICLSIETSGRSGSVAVGRGPQVLRVHTFSQDARHAVELLPSIKQICDAEGVGPADVAHVFVSAGPGSFTGIRIGITAARTLAWSTGATVVRVPTLDVIAQNALQCEAPPEHVAVVLDAKRGHVFAAAYVRAGGCYRAVSQPQECELSAWAATLPGGAALLGEGIAYHREAASRSGLLILPEHLNPPRPEVVHQLGYAAVLAGRFDDASTLIPIYIRRPEAEEKWEQRQQGL